MTRRYGVGVLVACVLAGSVASAPAHAQNASNAAAAQALFDEGLKLKDAGSYAQACPKLASSQKLDPGAGTALQLADCYEKNGQTASAWATYLDAIPLARAGNHPDWADRAKGRAAALEPHLSRLTIVVPPASDVQGLEIERDGVKVDRASWGSAIPVDPGAHPVVATAPKKQQWSTTVAVGPNGAKVDVTIPALQVEQGDGAPITPPGGGVGTGAGTGTGEPPKPPVVADTSTGASQRTIGLVVAGAGAVGLAVGGVFGLVAKSTYDDARTHCTTDNRCSADGVSGVDKANSQATLATVVMGVGAAALAGGLVLYFTAPSKAAPAVGLRVSPILGGASLGVGGAW